VVFSDYSMMVWLGEVFAPVVLRTGVHKRREKVRGGERVDARKHYRTRKVMMLL
jgi:hypothetical protein